MTRMATAPHIPASPITRNTLVVGIADMLASDDRHALLLTYSLGSCLGITAYDPVAKVGGLLHVMLPDSSINPEKRINVPYMFVDSGLPRLFQAVCNLGAEPRRLVVKVAGGSQFLDQDGVFNIGKRNFLALTALLDRQGCALQAADVGGVCSRTMRIELETGIITVKSPGLDSYLL